METDWNVECGADDPWVVVPWMRKDEAICFIDLRATPERLREIPEAAQFDCIAQALRCWNLPDAALFTAKCDVWSYGAELFDANDLEGHSWAQGSYIDLISTQPHIFTSFAASESLLRNWSTAAGKISIERARCEWTLRRARIFSAAVGMIGEVKALDGFATTLYVWGYGASPEKAQDEWANALNGLIEPVKTLVA